ncbi:20421_t:CDS:2, partial [Dentiscutata erythropus]
IAKEEFASSPHHPINIRKRIQESEYRLRFAKCVKASLKPNNEFNKFIEAVIRSDLEQLPKNEPLRSWHINTDAIPPIVFNQFLSEFKQLCIIDNKYRFILPDDIKIWVKNSWELLTDDLTLPNLNKPKYNREDEIFFLQIRNIFLKYKDISIKEISKKTWLTDTVHQFLEAAVCDIPGLSVHSTCATLLRHLGNEENRKPDRTVRLKLEDNQFEILYVEETSLISTISNRRAHPLIYTTTFHNIKIPFPTKDHVLQLSRGLKLISMMWEIRNVLKIISNNWRNILDSMEKITIILAEQRVKIDENIPQFRNFIPGQYQPIQYSYN